MPPWLHQTYFSSVLHRSQSWQTVAPLIKAAINTQYRVRCLNWNQVFLTRFWGKASSTSLKSRALTTSDLRALSAESFLLFVFYMFHFRKPKHLSKICDWPVCTLTHWLDQKLWLFGVCLLSGAFRGQFLLWGWELLYRSPMPPVQFPCPWEGTGFLQLFYREALRVNWRKPLCYKITSCM